MKILSWNVNGLRTLPIEKDLNCTLSSLDADLIAIQETKVTRELSAVVGLKLTLHLFSNLHERI